MQQLEIIQCQYCPQTGKKKYMILHEIQCPATFQKQAEEAMVKYYVSKGQSLKNKKIQKHIRKRQLVIAREWQQYASLKQSGKYNIRQNFTQKTPLEVKKEEANSDKQKEEKLEQ